MKPIYIRTEKDGTKIYHDYTCDRCDGAGFSRAWAMTGGYCYKCGGSGKLSRPRIVREYTEERIAQMQAEISDQMEENEKRMTAENFANLSRQYAQLGCSADGIGYVLKGNTYPYKNQIKRMGGRWHIWCWICPEKFETDGVEAVQVDVSKCVNEYGVVNADDMIWEAQRS